VRWRVSAAVVVALAGLAFADGRLKDLETGYDKELRACRIGARGFAIALERGKPMVGELPEIAADLDQLDKGQAVVVAYCDAVDSVLALLRADPNASYKSLERQLDERDNQIRKLRAASKKTTEELSPVLQRVIPKINAQAGAGAKPAPKRLKFPSGREIEPPKLPGTWKLSSSDVADVAEYTEKETTTIQIAAHPGARCDDIVTKAPHQTSLEHGGVSWRVSTPSKDWKPSWAHKSASGKVRHIETCVAIATGVIAVWIEEHDVTSSDPTAMLGVAEQMLAAWRSDRAAPKR
jgi:hypothetical protein